MESVDVVSTAPTMDALWAQAAWVTNLTDPAAALDRLHNTFLDVVINGPAPEDDDDEGRKKRRGDSDADEESEDLVDDFDEANNDLNDDAANDDDGSDALGNISENEDLEEEQYSDDDEGLDEFTHWINGTGVSSNNAARRGDEESRVARRATAGGDEGGVEAELRRVGLSTRDGQIVEQPMPERLAVIALDEGRPGLVHAASTAATSSSTASPVTTEAIWLLDQLTQHSRPYHNNTYVQSVTRSTPIEQRDHLLIRTIERALGYLLEEKLEPAYLMMYRQRELMPLLAALWSNKASQSLRDAAAMEERLGANVDYAYCLETGRRQLPLVRLKEGDVFQHTGIAANIGSGDSKWTCDPAKGSEEEARNEPRYNRARVKPCFIELGRLLVTILDLDVIFGRLERSRSVTLDRLRAAGPIADAHYSFLRKSGPYRDATDADAWASFATFVASIASVDQRLGGRALTVTANTAATKKLQRLGLEEAFETFALTGLQFQENLQNAQAIHTLPSQRPQEVYAFARAAGLAAQSERQLSGSEVLELFAKVMAEQYAQLPTLRRRVIQSFLRDGLVVVTYVRAIPGRASGQHRSVSIASLLESSPRDFLDLLEEQRHGMIRMKFYLDINLVLSVIESDALAGGAAHEPSWANERGIAFDIVAKRLIHTTRGYIKTILERVAALAVSQACCEKLSHSCAEGPYEPTQLNIEAYDPARRTWESEWNIVEALPSHDTALHSTLSSPSRRICGAFRGMNGVTCFTFLDASGNVLGHIRWVDVDLKTVEGRMRNAQQIQSLRQMLRKHFPSVIGVAAVADAQRLVQTLERLMFEELHKDLGVHIPVVWVSPMSAIVAANSSYMLRAAQNADSVTRCSICTARHLQDPLHQVCSMFDDQNSVLKLPIGVHRQANSRSLVAALQWEVSLWIAACGVDLSDVSRAPHAANVVQFVPGFGPRKAARLCDALRALPEPPQSRIELQQLLTTLFGIEVETNALTTFRVAAPMIDDHNSTSAYHPLDGTLIPRQWYQDAEDIIWRAVNCSRREYDENNHEDRRTPSDATSAALAASLFMSFNEAERRTRIEETSKFDSRYIEEFIKSELLSGYRSYMRRPYRIMINKLLFKLQTGVLFVSRSDMEYACPAEARTALQGNPLIVCEGSIEQGTVAGVRGGTIEGIRVNTTKGVPAFISADDIDVEVMRDELRDWNRYNEDDRLARERGEPRPLAKECPEWLRRGSLIHGTVSNCNYERGELRLRWCEAALEAAADEYHHAAAQADDAFGARSVNSVMTAQIIDAARVNMLKISRHDLFKNINGQRAAELLAGKCIGESLIRQSKHGKSNEALICVKVGSRSIANWPVREVRIHTGQVVYELRDERSQRNHRFHDVDHVLDSYIKRAVERIHTIRQHRKFVADSRDVSRRLAEDQRSGKFRLVYYFAEVEDEERPQTFYKLFYRLMNDTKDRSMKLHIDCENVFVRLPKGRGSYEWTPCASAEEASTLLKGFAANVMRGEKQDTSRRGGRRSEY
jgi:hypothetical protein